MRYLLRLTLAAALSACGSSGGEPLAPGRPAPVGEIPADEGADAAQPTAAGPAGSAANGPGVASNKDGPHISRSVGKEGGAVVFWPRVIPRTEEPAITSLAGDLQKKLVELTRKALPGRDVDVRPAPERVCPRAGCTAMTVGVLLTHGGGGCTVVALVSEPGTEPQRLIPWAGLVKLAKDEVPFREYAESQVTIRDSVPCSELLAALSKREAEVVKAIAAAAD